MTLTATVTTTKEVKLAAGLRKKLLTKLQTYAALKEQAKALELAMKKLNGEIGDLRDETGEQSVKLEGFTVTLVCNTRKKFNPKTFVANGGDLAIYHQSHDEVPVKAFTKITLPGATDESDE